jgi:hypothetical protein
LGGEHRVMEHRSLADGGPGPIRVDQVGRDPDDRAAGARLGDVVDDLVGEHSHVFVVMWIAVAGRNRVWAVVDRFRGDGGVCRRRDGKDRQGADELDR